VQRHLCQWTLQPIATLLAEEATAKLGGTVEIDVMGPLQAFDAGGSARAFATLVQGLAMATEARRQAPWGGVMGSDRPPLIINRTE